MSTMARRSLTPGLALLMIFASSSIAAGQQNSAAGSGTTVEDSTTAPRMTVENRRNVPAAVYLERGPFDVRLGTVAADRTETFPLPSFLRDGEDVRVFVHPEGGVDLAAHAFTVEAGEDVNLLIPSDDSGDIPGPPPEVTSSPDEGATTVTVENDMAQEVTLYLERGDFDIRLGVVPPRQERTLIVPSQVAEQEESVELVAHPEGGVDFPTRTFQVYPGAHLRMKIPPVG